MARLVLRHLVIMTSLLNPAFAALRHDVGLRQSDASDVIFTQNLLWTTTCTTRTQCAVNCMYDNLCVTFTVSSSSPVSGKKECRGHSVSSHSLTTASPLPGARLYRLRDRASLAPSVTTSTSPTTTTTTAAVLWLESTCNHNSDCPGSVTNAECFDHRCLCSPGYYYSWSRNDCVASCAENDLQDSLLEYPGRCIADNNVYRNTGQTLDSCKDRCITTPQCRSLEFFNGDVCTGASVTALQAWSSWNRYDGCSYYQRACA